MSAMAGRMTAEYNDNPNLSFWKTCFSDLYFAFRAQTPEQQRTAEQVRGRVEASGRWKQPITTTIEFASAWYPAEEYHQDYLRKHPGGYTCHFLRD